MEFSDATENLSIDSTEDRFRYLPTSSHSSPRLLPESVRIKQHETLILPVVYGCETWSVTLRSERKLREFEIRVLREIVGPKK
jgi:predicted PP-loop superfamily ATPase